ncbi:MFS transporter [Streptomyces cyaneofuscatus]|uniref:MFS transporter n=1 Tax=Streptomyces cyaneofuscatus TaxID=66883 RepID=UPI002952BAE8|nr:MFS transporter [Streptomyces cyaneofuscatus]WOP09614.1 MFS transporter [Streptomyces cyaneofuscatus]
MPFAVYVLGLAVFAQGTSEFMLSGLVSSIAADLGVSLAAAGLLTSAFAVGMVLGAPLMALAGRTWPRRRALLFFLAVFVAVHIAGALTPSYGVLLATRFVGALANAGFWAVALVSLPAFAAILRSLPGGVRGDGEAAPVRNELRVRDELRVLTGPRLRPTLLTMALVQGATFCAFSYLEPLLTRESGLSSAWVPAALALFGAGAFLGVTVAGRYADRRATALVAYGMVALALGWSALALTAGRPVAVLVLIPLLGLLAFGTGTALITRLLGQAAGAPTLAGASATAAFNLGAAVGPWAGGLALDAGLGHRAPVWVSAALMGLALVVTGARRAAVAVSGVRVTE